MSRGRSRGVPASIGLGIFVWMEGGEGGGARK